MIKKITLEDILPEIKNEEINAISLDNITLNSGLSEDKCLLNNASIELPTNEIVLLQGEHGSGKSMLLKLLAGLSRPIEGHYRINGESVFDMSFADFLPYRLNIGYAMETGGLISNKTVRRNLSLPLAYHEIGDEQEQKAKVEAAIERFGLAGVAESFPAELPGSFRRLAVIARALIMEPQLLLLDNPTTGLRYENKVRIANEVKKSWEKKAVKHVFVVSHDIRFIEQLAPTQCLKVTEQGIIPAEYE